MKPVVDGLQQEFQERVDFDVHADVNSDEEGSLLARAHEVSAVPTMMLTAADGTELKRWVGTVPVGDLRGAFDEALR